MAYNENVKHLVETEHAAPTARRHCRKWEEHPIELTIGEQQAKALLKEVLVELMEEKRDLFLEIMVEAIEEIGLANAIREGRRDEWVDEEQIHAILRGQA